MKEYNLSENKKLIVNLLSGIIVFGVNLIISFFLSPYIVENLGVEANGFISLANTFITYATLVTVALNSMAGRFVTIALHKNNYEEANKYYNAVFGGNLITATFLIVPAIICIIRLESIINIPVNLIFDVKILFSIIFINFFIGLVLPNWAIATFATNNLYLQSIKSLQSNILKVVSILLLFIAFSPKVYYIAIASLLCTIYIAFYNWYYHKKLLSQLIIKRKYFNWKYVKDLIFSGIWNTINQTGQMLLSGLDLLITNLFIGATSMGALSLAKTIPNVITGLAGTLTSVFMPTLTIDFAKNDKEALKRSLKKGMKLTGVLLTIPLAILIIYGREFYQLWVPSQDAELLQVLSVLTCFGLIFTSGIQCLHNVFTVVNKLKMNSILLLLSGIISTTIVFILLKTTNLGVFAVAGVSSFVNLARNMIYTVPFASRYLGLKWNTFFPEVLSSVISVIVLTIVGYIIKQFIIADSWILLILVCGITAIIGLVINMFIVLSNDERKYLLGMIKRRAKIA